MAIVKVDFNRDLRVFEIPETTIDSLKRRVYTAYGLLQSNWDNFLLKYKDLEDDFVTITSDEDFNLALRLNASPLRLFIFENNTNTSNNIWETETELMKEFRASTLSGSCVDYLLETYGIELSLPQFEVILDTLNISLDEASAIFNHSNTCVQSQIVSTQEENPLEAELRGRLTHQGVMLDLGQLRMLIAALRGPVTPTEKYLVKPEAKAPPPPSPPPSAGNPQGYTAVGYPPPPPPPGPPPPEWYLPPANTHTHANQNHHGQPHHQPRPPPPHFPPDDGFVGPFGPGAGTGSRPKGGARRLMARFVAHVTVPDRSLVSANRTFTKTWRLRNDSLQPWPTPAALALVGGNGEEMRSPDSISLEGGLLPGWEREVSIQLKAPQRPGLYEAFWRLREVSGRKFGQRLWCIIQVAENGGSEKDVVNSVAW